MQTGEAVTLDLAEKRHAWVQLISGSLDLNGELLDAGDGAAISEESLLTIKALEDRSEFLVFDLH